jgi:hypothetical protein
VLKLSLRIFLVLGVTTLGIGVVYFTRSEFMPYHAQAIQTDWSALSPGYQSFFLGLLKAVAAGQLIIGLATVLMSAMALRGDARPFAVLLPVVSLGYALLATYVTHVIATTTPAEPPLVAGVVSVLMATAATVMLQLGLRRERVVGQ